MELKALLKDLQQIADLQDPDIDPRFLATFQSSLNGGRILRDAVNKVRNGRQMQGTWEKSSQLTWGCKLRPAGA
jgi:hypothetical protein